MIGELVEGVTEALNRDAVEQVAEAEPQWLRQRRMDAWDVYERTPMPTTRREQWRYTDLKKKLHLEAMKLSDAEAAPDDMAKWPVPLREAMALDRENACGHIVFIDGHVVHTDIDEALASKGALLMSLHQAIEQHPDLLEEHLATKAVLPEDGKFAALNAALWTDGVLLHVPRGVRLERPVRVTRWFSESGVATFSRVLIVAESASQVSYVDEMLSDTFDEQSLVSVAVEVLAGDGAQVQYAAVQRLGEGAFYQSVQRTLAQRDAKLDTLNVALGASVSRVDLNARLLGPGADSDMLGLYFGDGEQHFDFNTSQDHEAESATSDLLYKGALDGSQPVGLPRASSACTRARRRPTPTRRTGTCCCRRTPGPTRCRTSRSRRTT